jgi:hypothetical protein
MSPGPGSAPPGGGERGREDSNEVAITQRRVRMAEPLGRAALIASVGGQRGWADWTDPDHRLRRLLAEFIGMAGLTFVSMNPARSLGPDVALGDLSTWWVYLIGPVAGATIAVAVAHVLRGPARVAEASAAEGTPLRRST